MTDLPTYLTRRQLREMLGLTRTDADRVFDRCQRYRLKGSGTFYVKAREAQEILEPQPHGDRFGRTAA